MIKLDHLNDHQNWSNKVHFNLITSVISFSEKAMATHSSTLAWKIPWMEELGRLQSMGSWRVGHDWATSLSLFTFMHWRRKWQPTPVFLPGESQGRGSLVGCRLWVTQSQTRLKQLSSSSSSSRILQTTSAVVFSFGFWKVPLFKKKKRKKEKVFKYWGVQNLLRMKLKHS